MSGFFLCFRSVSLVITHVEQVILVQSEVMSDLVEYGGTDFLDDFTPGATFPLDVSLVEHDAIRKLE